ncbi:MAG: hypothetical protein CVV24_06970 [Ignavibacteriae bacterium HGW-Ignavibacteriae-3]|nr:MAG: hypothetical protein CVV24_06970 [Ignavibacteriae bacterium HGW-Ignavibacteriae-3]
MTKARYSAIVFFTLILVSVALPLFYYINLPDRVASHFNITGRADGWMSKESFLIVELSVIIPLSGFFYAIIHFLPKFPDSLINLPNKEFWLGEERREESLKMFQHMVYWIGSLTLGFLSLIFQEVHAVNLAGGNKITPNVWIYLIIFLSAIIFIILKMYLHFNRIDKSI